MCNLSCNGNILIKSNVSTVMVWPYSRCWCVLLSLGLEFVYFSRIRLELLLISSKPTGTVQSTLYSTNVASMALTVVALHTFFIN